MGVSATSSENYATAIGNGATASGQYSLAFGQSTASADNAVAMGDTATKAQVPIKLFFFEFVIYCPNETFWCKYREWHLLLLGRALPQRQPRQEASPWEPQPHQARISLRRLVMEPQQVASIHLPLANQRQVRTMQWPWETLLPKRRYSFAIHSLARPRGASLVN